MRIAASVPAESIGRSAIILLLTTSLLVPIVVGSEFFFPYVVPRNILFRLVLELAVLVLALFLYFGRLSVRIHNEPILWALLSFLAASALSAMASPAPLHSFFGDFERMGGVWAWVHLTLFFLLLRGLGDRGWNWILRSALAISVFVSITAIVEHFLLGNPGDFRVNTASAATLGNAGLLAGYLLMAIGIACYFATTQARFRQFYALIALVDLVALVYTENRTSVAAVLLGAVAAGTLFTLLRRPSQRWYLVAAGVTAAAGAIGILSFSPLRRAVGQAAYLPKTFRRIALTSFAGDDQSRLSQWHAALAGFRQRPLLGYGMENHNLVWGLNLDPAFYALKITDNFDRTHNQFLELLATTGILGTLAFAGLWITIAISLARGYRAKRISLLTLSVLVGLEVAYATYLFFWFFDINSTMLWVMVAALIASRVERDAIVRLVPQCYRFNKFLTRALAVAIAGVVLASLYAEALIPLNTSRVLHRIETSQASIAATLADFELLSRTHAHQTAHIPIVMGEFIGSLRPQFKIIRRDSSERRSLERMFDLSFLVFRREIHRDTLNDRLYTSQAELLMDAAQFYDSRYYTLQAAAALRKAVDLSPNRRAPRLMLTKLERGQQISALNEVTGNQSSSKASNTVASPRSD